MTLSHTPTPWKAKGNTVYGADDFPVAKMETYLPVEPRTLKEMHDNAALIVKTVNAHEKLKLALRDLLDQVDTLSDFTFNGDMENHEHETCFEGAIDYARSLLKALDAKAGA